MKRRNRDGTITDELSKKIARIGTEADHRFHNLMTATKFSLKELRVVLASESFKQFAALYPKDSPGRDPSGKHRKPAPVTAAVGGTPQ